MILSRIGPRCFGASFLAVVGMMIAACSLAAQVGDSLPPAGFPPRLARGGLRSLTAAPLLLESRVFGVLLAARKEPDAFTSLVCEFLRQLSEHVALAARQAQIHTALQQAYDDLRQSQQAVMQQERLRTLGWGQRLAAEGDIPPHVDRLLSKPPKLRELREALAQLVPKR